MVKHGRSSKIDNILLLDQAQLNSLLKHNLQHLTAILRDRNPFLKNNLFLKDPSELPDIRVTSENQPQNINRIDKVQLATQQNEYLQYLVVWHYGVYHEHLQTFHFPFGQSLVFVLVGYYVSQDDAFELGCRPILLNNWMLSELVLEGVQERQVLTIASHAVLDIVHQVSALSYFMFCF